MFMFSLKVVLLSFLQFQFSVHMPHEIISIHDFEEEDKKRTTMILMDDRKRNTKILKQHYWLMEALSCKTSKQFF